VPVAFVVRRDPALTEAMLIDACRGAIASYKLPKEVRFLTAEALPRNVSGKVERRLLEALLEALLDEPPPRQRLPSEGAP
jgi:acyl-CoA synthetase (AMP-forming)/AMP-acid ligase II